MKEFLKIFSEHSINSNMEIKSQPRPTEAQKAANELTAYFSDANETKTEESYPGFDQFCKERGLYFDGKTMSIKQKPGKYETKYGYEIIGNDGYLKETVYYPENPKKCFTVEHEYNNDGDRTRTTYKDGNGNVKYTEEFTKSEVNDERGITQKIIITKTTKDADGKVIYTKIIESNWNSETYKYEDNVVYKNANGEEITKEEADALRDQYRTESMKTALNEQDRFQL